MVTGVEQILVHVIGLAVFLTTRQAPVQQHIAPLLTTQRLLGEISLQDALKSLWYRFRQFANARQGILPRFQIF